ncbi:MAG: hypothetical protein ABIN57_06005 [Chitinophagaceae bacterium]
MNNLQPLIFLAPIIALILVVAGYFFLVKREINKVIFKRLVFLTTLFAFVMNFAWEVIQMQWYKNTIYDILHISFCALASVADVIMVLLIYFGFALAYKNAFWIREVSIQRVLVLMAIGAIGAILAEMRHLTVGAWAYAPSMPMIPIVDVGISPVFQFMLLPILIFYLSFFMLKFSSFNFSEAGIKKK